MSTSDPYDSFRSILADSETMRCNWNSVVAEVSDEIFERHGIRVGAEEIMKLASARTRAITGDDSIQVTEDAENNLAALKRARENRALKEALAREETARSAAEELTKTLAPAQRLAKARELGARVPVKEKPQTTRTPEEIAGLVAEAQRLPAGMRMAFCRKHGL